MKIFLVIFLVVSIVACNKRIDPVEPPSLPPPDNLLIVNVDQTKQSYVIPSTFQGLSYETSILANAPSFLNKNNTVLIQLIRNLGPGVLRLGGNSSDNVLWTGTARSESTSANSVTTTEIDNLSAFAKAIGWKVLFGLNLGTFDASAAANEADYVSKTLQEYLLAIQFGNEPDGYHSWNPKRATTYGYPEFKPEWESYFNAVKKLNSSIPFAGPDIAYRSEWVTSFAADESKNVVLFDGHYYQNGPASDPAININSLFTPIPQYSNYFQVINAAAISANLPWRITECNSINGGGKSGVSDVFASALWALDFMWMVAKNNGQGVNFHGGNSGAYSPFATSGGIPLARPIYYAFLAFKYGTEGATIIPVTLSAAKYACSAYACMKEGSTSITLINKNSTKNLDFKVQTTNKVNTIRIARLTAPSISSMSGVKFCKSTVSTNGTFQLGNTEDLTIGGINTFTITLPAASAAVVTIQ